MIVLALGKRDFFLKRKCQARGNLYDKAKDARHVGCSKIRHPSVCLSNIALGHSPLEIISKRFDKGEIFFDCFNRS